MTDINVGAITESLNYKSDLDLGNTSPSTSTKQTIIGWGIPDLTTATGVSTSSWTSSKKQWLFVDVQVSNGNYFNIKVNGVYVFTLYGNQATTSSTWYMLDIGDEITYEGVSAQFNCKTYDFKL